MIAVRIVADSYAWVEIFSGTEKGKIASKFIDEADEIYTPDIVLAEIARKYLREGANKRVVEQRLDWIIGASSVVTVDRSIAIESGSAFLELRQNARDKGLSEPSLFDAIILGTARSIQAKVLTGDQHFRYFSETLWL
jgi:predicted nucleic acid-binding protein